MKLRFSHLLFAICCIGLTIEAQALEKPIEVPKGDYCAAEAAEWVHNRFGPETKILLNILDKSSCDNNVEARCYRYNVWTDLCDGYFTFQYGAYSYRECKEPQWERERMLYSVGAVGSCTRFLKGFDYPNS